MARRSAGSIRGGCRGCPGAAKPRRRSRARDYAEPRAQRSVFATRASATSPTACRLLALTLSGVSSGVCQWG